MEKDISLLQINILDRCVKRAISPELWKQLDDTKSDLVIEVSQPTDSLHMLASGLDDDATQAVQRELAFASWDILTTVRMNCKIPSSDPLVIQYIPHMCRLIIRDRDEVMYAVQPET